MRREPAHVRRLNLRGNGGGREAKITGSTRTNTISTTIAIMAIAVCSTIKVSLKLLSFPGDLRLHDFSSSVAYVVPLRSRMIASTSVVKVFSTIRRANPGTDRKGCQTRRTAALGCVTVVVDQRVSPADVALSHPGAVVSASP